MAPDLSRRVGVLGQTDELCALRRDTEKWLVFLQDMGTAETFADLPDNAQETILRAEAEGAAVAGEMSRSYRATSDEEYDPGTDETVVAFALALSGAFDELADAAVDAVDATAVVSSTGGVPGATVTGVDPDAAAARAWERASVRFRDAFAASHRTTNSDAAAEVADALSLPLPTLIRRADYHDLVTRQATRLAALAPDISVQTATAIAQAVDALRAGEITTDDLQGHIRSLVRGAHLYPGIAKDAGPDAATAYRAQVIAATETSWARNHAHLTFYEAGDVSHVRVSDGDGCGWLRHDDTDMAHGSIRAIADARNHPLAHPHCRRRFYPVIAPQE